MSAETIDLETYVGTSGRHLLAGVAGGFVGTVLMGAFMHVMNPGTLKAAIPAMYGFAPSAAIGWAFHVWHGLVLGGVYAVAVDNVAALRERVGSPGGAVAGGVGYGVATTALPVFVMPLWLFAVGFGAAPPFPNLGFPATVMSAAMHVVYAVPVALAYYIVARNA